MDVTPSQSHRWIVEPLLARGVSQQQATDLLFRLAFRAIVCDGPDDAVALADLVGDQPPAVRMAWLTMLGRMLTTHPPTDDVAR